jgi:hypothetical protein
MFSVTNITLLAGLRAFRAHFLARYGGSGPPFDQANSIDTSSSGQCQHKAIK